MSATAAAADLVPSISIENLLQKRAAIAARAAAIERSIAENEEIFRSILPGDSIGRRSPLVQLERNHHEFTAADYMQTMDASLWARLLEESGLRSFMDATSRSEWDQSISDRKVPELTRENVESTFRSLYASRGDMFEQGVIRLFRSLSWDYKTNLPHKFGMRLVLTRAVNTFKRGDFYGIEHHAASKLDDLIRVLSVIDGKPEPDHRSGAYYKLGAAKWMLNRGSVFVRHAELPYLEIKGFRNGNAHIKFTASARVDALNRIIAKHYPGALPPAREAT